MPPGGRAGGARGGPGRAFWAVLVAGVSAAVGLWVWARPAPPAGGTLVVSDPFDDQLVAVELATGAVRSRLKVGRLPHQLVPAPGNRLYVAETGSQSVSFVDVAGGRTLNQRIVGAAPDNPSHRARRAAIAKAPSCKACHQMRVVGSLPASLTLGRGGGELWVTELRGRRVSRLAPASLKTRDQVGFLGGDMAPSGVLAHPATGDLYVVARTYKGDMPLGPTGPALRVSADPEHAPGAGTSELTAFDATLGKPKGRLALPFAGAYTGAFAPDGKTLYLTFRGADRVAAIGLSPLRVLRTWAAPQGPTAIAFAGDALAVTGFDTDPGVVAFYDPADGKPLGQLKVPANPSALASHPRTGQLFVACSGANQVVEIDPRTRTETRRIEVGAHASGIAVFE